MATQAQEMKKSSRGDKVVLKAWTTEHGAKWAFGNHVLCRVEYKGVLTDAAFHQHRSHKDRPVRSTLHVPDRAPFSWESRGFYYDEDRARIAMILDSIDVTEVRA